MFSSSDTMTMNKEEYNSKSTFCDFGYEWGLPIRNLFFSNKTIQSNYLHLKTTTSEEKEYGSSAFILEW